MKSLEISEFTEQADSHLVANEPLTITRDGRPIGRYLPFRVQGTLPRISDKAGAAEAAARLAATLHHLYSETGMTEDEFVAAFMDDSPPQERG